MLNSSPLAVRRSAGRALAGLLVQGRNRISVACLDARAFVVVTQLVRRRSVDEVKALMRAPESLDEALARVRRQVGSICFPNRLQLLVFQGPVLRGWDFPALGALGTMPECWPDIGHPFQTFLSSALLGGVHGLARLCSCQQVQTAPFLCVKGLGRA